MTSIYLFANLKQNNICSSFCHIMHTSRVWDRKHKYSISNFTFSLWVSLVSINADQINIRSCSIYNRYRYLIFPNLLREIFLRYNRRCEMQKLNRYYIIYFAKSHSYTNIMHIMGELFTCVYYYNLKLLNKCVSP